MRGIMLFVLCACGSPGQATPDGPDGGYALTCESGGATFPLLDKSCSVASDCFVAVHQINCCGTQTAIGLNASSQSAFSSAETQCSGAYPGCGCAQFPTTAEDGRSEDMGAIQVDCRSGQCFTFVP